MQDDVARLFTADVEAASAHPLHHIAVAHLGALQRQALCGQFTLQPQVGHDGGDEAASGQPPAFGPVHPDQSHDLVAVHHPAGLVADDDPVGVPVQGDADVGAVTLHRRRDVGRIGRAAVGVDVQPVGLHPHGEDLGPQFVQSRGRDLIGGTVGAVDGDAQALEAEALGEDGLGDLDITVTRVIDAANPAQAVRRGQALVKALVHHGLDLQLDFVRQLIAVGPEQLDAVVRIVVVRGRDHDAQVGAHRPGHHGHARRRHGTEGAHVHADRGKAGDQGRFDHIAGQAGILADDHQMAAVVVRHEQLARRQADAQRHLGGHRMGVGAAPNAVGSEIASIAQGVSSCRGFKGNLPKPHFKCAWA